MRTAPLLQFTQRVMGEIHSILREKYHASINPDLQSVRFYLYSRKDLRLEELKDALERMAHGKYRKCMMCGGQIADEVLLQSLTSKVCEKCSL